MNYQGDDTYSEDDTKSKNDFDDRHVRKTFVCKVYGIVSLQMFFTFGVVFGVTFTESWREWFFDRDWMTALFAVLGLVIYLALACCEETRRAFPVNVILLILLTITNAMMATGASSKLELPIIYIAFLTTGCITILMSLAAKILPCDVTGLMYFFYVSFVSLITISALHYITCFIIICQLVNTILGGVLVFLLSLYLVFITQIIMGGKHVEISPDEIILAVILLYTTIIDLFLNLLTIIQACFGEGT